MAGRGGVSDTERWNRFLSVRLILKEWICLHKRLVLQRVCSHLNHVVMSLCEKINERRMRELYLGVWYLKLDHY